LSFLLHLHSECHPWRMMSLPIIVSKCMWSSKMTSTYTFPESVLSNLFHAPQALPSTTASSLMSGMNLSPSFTNNRRMISCESSHNYIRVYLSSSSLISVDESEMSFLRLISILQGGPDRIYTLAWRR
jgi:hypothetical protein